MLYRRLADAVVVFHALVALFFLVGVVAVKLQPWLALVHVPLVIWVCAAFVMGWTCPLTPLENRLRTMAGSQGYEGSFVDHYLGAAVGMNRPKTRNRAGEVYLGIFLAVVNVATYFGLFYRQLWN